MITYWFPIGIYHNFYPHHSILKDEILKLCSNEFNNKKVCDDTENWPFWTKMMQDGTINPLKSESPIVEEFSNWITSEVVNFSKSYGSTKHYSIEQCWLNYYNKGDFQETHIHLGFDFSAIYFISAPPKSGKVIFENPNAIAEMRPITSESVTDLNNPSAIYEPKEGLLIVFRSNLRHGVFPHRDTEPRISIAFNLKES